ncbi:MAG: hypothetical protein JWM07_155 [Candidatus Saccharibacteria bacterium]|nr:hypothetical protein [Candidatus Saccharibacteria bacterium]
MLNYEAVPLLDPTARYVFEAASQNKNTILQASVLMDAQITDAQMRAHYDPNTDIPDFHDEIAHLTHFAQQSIEEADQTGQGTWTDYYRLVSQTAFLEQRMKAPFVFAERRFWRERDNLVNGIYGISAQIIDDALREYDSESATPSDKEQLRGVIQEQTFLTLFNKAQQQKNLAVPSATCSDLYHKIDAEAWIFPDRQTDPMYIPVQIKSSVQDDEQFITPQGGITLYAHEFNNNNRHLSISRLLAHEHHFMNGTAKKLPARQQQQLNIARNKLFATMSEKIQHIR